MSKKTLHLYVREWSRDSVQGREDVQRVSRSGESRRSHYFWEREGMRHESQILSYRGAEVRVPGLFSPQVSRMWQRLMTPLIV
jgi:hypothetical protein